MMLRNLAISMGVTALALSCDSGATGPRGSLCDTRHGAEVCVDRAEYGLHDVIAITTRNVSDRAIFKDACGTSRVAEMDSEDVRPIYAPHLNCGPGVTLATIVERMVRLEPGASTQETLQIGFAVQDFYRVYVWILAADGTLAADSPATSGFFTILPSGRN
ncbi:hypothetical protein [Candidatus Palauibacter sp.]|uniref:hypothetical protein n=1 Tax=Candidatus Palauibacter sp. TaxID=3101350 RepID=UPI003AF25020